MAKVLPLVAEFKAAVIGLCQDDDGIPATPEKRLEVAKKIIKRAATMGIPKEDIIIDCLAMTMGAESKAGWTTLETTVLIREELGVNIALGASNVSYGLPDRELLNGAFIPMAIAAGVTVPIINTAKMGPFVLAADLSLGRDESAMRYLKGYRQRVKSEKEAAAAAAKKVAAAAAKK
eukprot:788059_1